MTYDRICVQDVFSFMYHVTNIGAKVNATPPTYHPFVSCMIYAVSLLDMYYF